MIRLNQVTKVYSTSGAGVVAVEGVNLELAQGEFLALVGPSGCGKTTLINLMAGIDRPTSGEVWFDGERLDLMTDDRLSRLRRTRIGIVYQFFNLLPTLSAWENVALPLLLDGAPTPDIRARVAQQLERVKLTPRAHHRPHELSGGEQQRVAIARALVVDPRVVLADEPTGNLDSVAGGAVLELLQRLHRDRRYTIVLATHSPEGASRADRIVSVRDGKIERIDRGK
jgi:putative ABC transport system ATP-binding protein